VDRKIKAYSLIELLFVIAILFILASFAYREMLVYIARERLKGATEEILGELNWIKTKSTVSSISYGLCIDTSENKVIIFQDENKNNKYDTTIDPVVRTLQVLQRYPGISVNASSSLLCPRAAVFNRFSYLANGIPGKVILSNNFGETKEITISQLGRIRLK